jgi:hypothetical protein
MIRKTDLFLLFEIGIVARYENRDNCAIRRFY